MPSKFGVATQRTDVPQWLVDDVRAALHGLFDTDSVLELRGGFGLGAITALARIEGHPVGVLACNPAHLAGAVDTDAATKAARFLDLCQTHRLPIVFLVDTPGFMVGPDVEATGLVRAAGQLFVSGARLTVPTAAVVLRKAYGLGAMAMMGGSLQAPLACVAWPTGELGGMGLEGAVRLGFRAELEAKGVEFTSGVQDQGYGLVTSFLVPAAGQVHLFQPRYTPPFQR